ncbi:MAPEG family protein [Caulobacter sp. 17J80-11]|uniref:MAPEG family protein n=1 Tax=Caulobacter sp. 17J80-11 TaxID=2763502 RepID=UPI00165390E8|nr:MAPEG family protein [Caulobacter sp. 17J80-11]MBC6982022.1 MAPEG family protein [Caulobacter sp. 17J80-11]
MTGVQISELAFKAGCRPEFCLLGAAILLGVLHLAWAAYAARMTQGLKWGAGARDTDRPLGKVAGRLDRAYKNYMETFPFFAAAVLLATVTGKLGELSLWGSLLYVVARIVYVPLYALGVPTVRSLVWFVSLVGLLMVLAAPFV